MILFVLLMIALWIFFVDNSDFVVFVCAFVALVAVISAFFGS